MSGVWRIMGKVFREQVVSLYVDEEKTTTEIASILKVSTATVYSCLRRENVTMRHQGQTRGSREVDALTDKIIYYYVDQKKSLRQIGRLLGIPFGKVHWILNKAGIKLRPNLGLRFKVTDEMIEKIKQLYPKYKSSQRVAREVGISHVYVIQLLRKEGIAIRKRAASGPDSNLWNPKYHSKSFVKRVASLYIDKRVNIHTIVKILNVSEGIVRNALICAGIEPLRYNPSARCRDKELIAKIVPLYVKEKMGCYRIAKIVGVNPGMVYDVLKAARIRLRPKIVAKYHTEKFIKNAIYLYAKKGFSIADVGRFLGAPDYIIRSLLRRENVIMRKSAGPNSLYQDTDFIAKVIELYKTKSILEISKELGGTHETIRRILIKVGIQRRTPGHHQRRPYKVTDTMIDAMKRLYAENKSTAVIGDRVGLSSVHVLTVLRKAGVEIRSRGHYKQANQ